MQARPREHAARTDTIEITDTTADHGAILIAARDPSVARALAHHALTVVADGSTLHGMLEDPFVAGSVDVVVAEIDLDGGSALDALAHTPHAGRPPVVLLSRRMSRALVAHARVAGAFVVLREPIVPEHLTAVVDRLVRRAA
jgi:DNA-binding response OmpR family regulator